MKTLNDFDFKGKSVLLRCDFNVPLKKNGDILDDFRIRQCLPSIRYLIKKRAKIILMSHLGRPQGKVVKKLRLNKVQKKLTEHLGIAVIKAQDCVGKETEDMARNMVSGQILLLENLRFHKQEKENSRAFAKKLACLADIYINEAFSVCHRNHASVSGVPEFLPSGAGLLLEKEIKALSNFLKKPKKPLVAILGGKKAETKARLIARLINIADFVLIGDLLSKEIEEKNITFKYPEKIIRPRPKNPSDKTPLDISAETLSLFLEKIKKAKTIFWSGPLGKTEEPKYSKGSKAIAKAIIKSRAFSVVGGGETIGFINKQGLTKKFNHVCTGGGAMLAFLAGEKLPGLEALK